MPAPKPSTPPPGAPPPPQPEETALPTQDAFTTNTPLASQPTTVQTHVPLGPVQNSPGESLYLPSRETLDQHLARGMLRLENPAQRSQAQQFQQTVLPSLTLWRDNHSPVVPLAAPPSEASSSPQPWDAVTADMLSKSPQLGPVAAQIAECLWQLQQPADPQKGYQAHMAAATKLINLIGNDPNGAKIREIIAVPMDQLIKKLPADHPFGKGLKSMVGKLVLEKDPAKAVARAKQLAVLMSFDLAKVTSSPSEALKQLRALYETLQEFGPDIKQMLPEKARQAIEKLEHQLGPKLPTFLRSILPLMEHSDFAKAFLKLLTADHPAAVASGTIDLMIAVGRVTPSLNSEAFKAVTAFLKLDTVVTDTWKNLFTAMGSGDLETTLRSAQQLASTYSVKFDDIGQKLGLMLDESALKQLGVGTSDEAMKLFARLGERNPEEILRKAEFLGIVEALGQGKMSDLTQILDQLGAKNLEEATQLIAQLDRLSALKPSPAAYQQAQAALAKLGHLPAADGQRLIQKLIQGVANPSLATLEEALSTLKLDGKRALSLMDALGTKSLGETLTAIDTLGVKSGEEALLLMEKLGARSLDEAVKQLEKLGVREGSKVLELMARLELKTAQEALQLIEASRVPSLADVPKVIGEGKVAHDGFKAAALRSWDDLTQGAADRLGATAEQAWEQAQKLGFTSLKAAAEMLEQIGLNADEAQQLMSKLGAQDGPELLQKMTALGYAPASKAGRTAAEWGQSLLQKAGIETGQATAETTAAPGKTLLKALTEAGVESPEQLQKLLTVTGTTTLETALAALKGQGLNLRTASQALAQLALTSIPDAQELMRSTGLKLTELAPMAQKLGIPAPALPAHLTKLGLTLPQSAAALESALSRMTQTFESSLGRKLSLGEIAKYMETLGTQSAEEALTLLQRLGPDLPAEQLAEVFKKLSLKNGQEALACLEKTGAPALKQLGRFAEKLGGVSAQEAAEVASRLMADSGEKLSISQMSKLMDQLGGTGYGKRAYTVMQESVQRLGFTDLKQAVALMEKLGVANIAELERLATGLLKSGFNGLRMPSHPGAMGEAVQAALREAEALKGVLTGSLADQLKVIQKLYVTSLSDLKSLTQVAGNSQLIELAKYGLKAAELKSTLKAMGLTPDTLRLLASQLGAVGAPTKVLDALVKKSGSGSLKQLAADMQRVGYKNPLEWLKDMAHWGKDTSFKQAIIIAEQLKVPLPALSQQAQRLKTTVAGLPGQLKTHGLSTVAELEKVMKRLGAAQPDDLSTLLKNLGMKNLKDAIKCLDTLGVTTAKEGAELVRKLGAHSLIDVVDLMQVSKVGSAQSLLKHLEARGLNNLNKLGSAEKLGILRITAQMGSEEASTMAQELADVAAKKPEQFKRLLEVMEHLGPKEMEALFTSSKIAKYGLQVIEEMAAIFKKMGVPFAMAAPKIAKGLGKAIPAIGAAFSGYDAVKLGKIATTGAWGDKTYADSDVRKLAYLGAKVNTVDTVLALAEALGVGNVAFLASLGMAGVEILIDVLVDYYNEHPEALTTTARIAINAALAASGPDGAAIVAGSLLLGK